VPSGTSISFALAELMMSNMPLRIDEMEGGPVFVLESTPHRMVVIDRERHFSDER
jgi:hypothetical protein